MTRTDDDKIKNAPWVAQVGVRVADKAVGDNLVDELKREDGEVDPLQLGEQGGLPRERGVERVER